MKKLKFDSYDGVCFLNGLVFFAPVALLVRTQAGVSEHVFFILQALLSGVIFLGEIPTGFITDKIGYRKSLILAQVLLLGARSLLLAAFVSRSRALPPGREARICTLCMEKTDILQKRHTQEISEQQVLSSVQLRMPGFIK